MARKARAAAAKLVQNFPDVPGYREDLAFSCTLLARYLGNQSDEVMALHREAIDLAEGLLIEKPDSATCRSFLARALAGLWRRCQMVPTRTRRIRLAPGG